MAIVVGVSGLVVGFVLQTNGMAETQQCYTDTVIQVRAIRNAVESFARKNDRLPLPAARNVGVESTTFGRESSGANIDQIGSGLTGVSFGAVPFQALGMPSSFAADCWGNKLTFVVTTALTTSAASGGYLDSTVLGNIALKSTTGVTNNTTIAYAIISHGADGLGAVKLNYSAANGANTPPYVGHGWCSGATTMKNMNCLATAASVANTAYNDGKGAPASFFDDVVIAAGRPQILSTGSSNLYCWGSNGYGQVGDGTTTQRLVPTAVSGLTQFSQVSTGYTGNCALDLTGLIYCWGTIGDYNYSIPTAKALPGGIGAKWVAVGGDHACAVGSDGKAYCWGYGPGQGSYKVTSFTLATMPGGVTFQQIAASVYSTCALSTAGNVYCWGSSNGYGEMGNGTTSGAGGNATPTIVTMPGGVTFTQLSSYYTGFCALSQANDIYCWGRNDDGAAGMGSVTTAVTTPTIKSLGLKYKSVNSTCGLTFAGALYCSGYNVEGAGYFRPNPTLVSGAWTFSYVGVGGAYCGSSNYQTYCWGNNGSGQLGDNSTTSHWTPSGQTGGTWPKVFGTLPNQGGSGGIMCGINPLPPASWGENRNGEVGLGSTCGSTCGSGPSPANGKYNTPTYAYNSAAAGTYNYLTYITGGGTRCGISDAGKIHCWGKNDQSQTGDGTQTTPRLTPSTVPFPTGVAAWKAVYPNISGTMSCAIASGGTYDSQLFCWGYYNWSMKLTPTLYTSGCTGNTVSSITSGGYGMGILCTNGAIIAGDGLAITAGSMPAGTNTVKQYSGRYYGQCLLIDNSIDGNGQIYCSCSSGNANADGCVIGDGTPNPSSTLSSGSYLLKRVTLPTSYINSPATITKFTAYANAAYSAGSGPDLMCGLGDDGWVYCWGSGFGGGSSSGSAVLVPTAVPAPTGVTSFLGLYGSGPLGSYITMVGNDGKAYVVGQFYYDAAYDYGNSTNYNKPTLMPLPPGATSYILGTGTWPATSGNRWGEIVR